MCREYRVASPAVAAVALCAALSSGGCNGRAARSDEKSPAMQSNPAPPPVAPLPAASPLDADTLADLRAADLVLVGEVVAIGPPPSSWSGRIAQFQAVTYRIMRTLKSAAPLPTDGVTLHHPIVHGLRGVQKDAPAIDARLLPVGARVILLATTHGERRDLLETDRAILGADDLTLSQVVKELQTPR